MDTEQTGIIYLITSPSGGRYVGKTEKTLHKRWMVHKQAAKAGAKSPLHRAIRKYGAENLTVETICNDVPFKWLCAIEIAFINLLGTFRNKHDYNATVGGEGTGSGPDHPCFGNKLSPEHKAKIAPPKGRKGTPHTVETKAKLRALNLGKPAHNKGKPASEEQKLKQSLAMKGRPSPTKGKPMSGEHRRKLSMAKAGKKNRQSSSDYFGVYQHKQTNKWLCSVYDERVKRRVYQKLFNIELEAARAYNEKVQELGLDRPLNILPELVVAA